jgi:hypothetical protein
MVTLYGRQETKQVKMFKATYRPPPKADKVRRPSHADKRSRLGQEVLKRTFFETFGHSRKNRKIARQFYKLLKLAA